MKALKAFCVACIALACYSALAESWLTVPVKVTTNRVAVTLGNEFTPPKVLLGYWQAPNAEASYTNSLTFTLTRGRYDWFSRTDAFTNGPLRVTGLDLLVQQGDVLVFTNDFATGVLYLNYQVD